MRIETTIRRDAGCLVMLLPAVKAKLLAQAWGITPNDLVGRAVVLDMEV